MELSKRQLLDMHQRMCTIRAFEETVADLFHRGQVPGSVHLSIGQEACSVGVCAALEAGDYLVTTHRGHGHILARGADINRMMAEVLGRKTGLCAGKGGSLHIADFSVGVIGAMGIVAGGLPVATGAALAAKMMGGGRVVASFFGDGASNEGTFHESLNVASLWSLPIVYVCENNLYGISTHVRETVPTANVADRAAAYAMRGVVADGNDLEAVCEAAEAAVSLAREGRGPTLLELKTYRWHGHFEGEDVVFEGRTYRSREEIEEWKLKDPIAAFRRRLLERGLAAEAEIATAELRARETVEEAVRFARESPYPEPEESLETVYAESRGGR